MNIIEKATHLNKLICARYPNAKPEGKDFDISVLFECYEDESMASSRNIFDAIMWETYNIHYRDFMTFINGKHQVDIEALENAIDENILAFE